MMYAMPFVNESLNCSNTGKSIFKPRYEMRRPALPMLCLLELARGSCGAKVRTELQRDPGIVKFLDRLIASTEFKSFPQEVGKPDVWQTIKYLLT